MQVVPEVYVLEWSFFVVQRLALHQNGVQFHQQSIGDIGISQAMLQDFVRRCAMLLENWLITHTHTQKHNTMY